jgi:hypothetical protein
MLKSCVSIRIRHTDNISLTLASLCTFDLLTSNLVLDINHRADKRSIEKSLRDIYSMESHCDYAKLAVATLLLALLKQRERDIKGTRFIFAHFFSILASTTSSDFKCNCCAKVLQAFGLFEMKCGNARKSLFLLEKAVSLDETLSPVLNWGQVREVKMARKKGN